nr:hypothetical protein CFP56_00709 [Quercus suber]
MEGCAGRRAEVSRGGADGCEVEYERERGRGRDEGYEQGNTGVDMGKVAGRPLNAGIEHAWKDPMVSIREGGKCNGGAWDLLRSTGQDGCGTKRTKRGAKSVMGPLGFLRHHNKWSHWGFGNEQFLPPPCASKQLSYRAHRNARGAIAEKKQRIW